VQKIKGAQDIRLSYKSLIPTGNSLLKILDSSNNQTLADIQHLQKIFAKNAALVVADFQGLIAEDGQLYIMDPQGIDSSERGHSDQLNALQALKQTVLEHHKHFTLRRVDTEDRLVAFFPAPCLEKIKALFF
jgi:hypothetical protein